MPDGPSPAAVGAALAGAGLGLERGAVALAPADPGWAAAYERLAAVLRAALPEAAAGIEHIGSTAVPGLPAKPILDVAVGIRPGDDGRAAGEVLAGLGFLLRGEADGEGVDRNFGWEDRPRHRLANLHLVTRGGRAWRDYLGFRDRLRDDPAARDAYARVKRGLAERHGNDRKAYVAGKGGFVARTVAGAR